MATRNNAAMTAKASITPGLMTRIDNLDPELVYGLGSRDIQPKSPVADNLFCKEWLVTTTMELRLYREDDVAFSVERHGRLDT